METKPLIDWTKPIAIVKRALLGGIGYTREATYVGSLTDGSHAVSYWSVAGNLTLARVRADGTYFYNGNSGDPCVVQKKEKKSAWVNIYHSSGLRATADSGYTTHTELYKTKEDASRWADLDRVACVLVEWEE